jgi:HD-GYP domain-containing protein (c-di-GMP phosphodiesterase class II)
MLEESSVEAIESLNATVEAKDPYTAGHSLRVQRIAVSLAQELGVPSKEVDVVRQGGLFAAVAKRPADFGVPDSEALVAG